METPNKILYAHHGYAAKVYIAIAKIANKILCYVLRASSRSVPLPIKPVLKFMLPFLSAFCIVCLLQQGKGGLFAEWRCCFYYKCLHARAWRVSLTYTPRPRGGIYPAGFYGLFIVFGFCPSMF